MELQRLMLMDERDYDGITEEIRRIAVRGIITVNGKLLFVEDSAGVLKLPGGGQDEGETDLQTLVREVREETGYAVIPASVRPFGYIEEKRRSKREEMIWHQFNRLYFCDVAEERGKCEYSENEKSCGMHLRACTLDEAIKINLELLGAKGNPAWSSREYNTLLLIKEHR